MKRPKISIAIATYNEENNIGTCLGSVSKLADEIIVVDGRSTDRSVEIAEKFGAKMIVTDNPPIFHINKQKAIDACNGDWILQLDADEEVSAPLCEEILSIINQTDFTGLWIPRRNFFLGRYLTKGGQYPDYTLRLYRRGKGKLPCKSVHEQAVVEGRIGYLKNDLVHNPFPNFSEYLNKAMRYATLLADEYEEQKLKTNFPSTFKYVFWIPTLNFLSLYLKHKGFLDGFAGFIFALFSSIQKIIAYVIYWERINVKKL